MVTTVLQGDCGKPCLALVFQAVQFAKSASAAVLLVTTTLTDAPLFRLTVGPMSQNRLRVPSWVMIDKPMTLHRGRIGQVFGRLEEAEMVAVN